MQINWKNNQQIKLEKIIKRDESIPYLLNHINKYNLVIQQELP